MKLNDVLLVKMIEEASESSQAAAKILRFGIDDKNPDTGVTNVEQLREELFDAIHINFVVLGFVLGEKNEDTVGREIGNRNPRMFKYLEYSAEKGLLDSAEIQKLKKDLGYVDS